MEPPTSRPRDAHRGWARAAVLLAIVAMAGAFLPWFTWNVPSGNGTPGSGTAGDFFRVLLYGQGGTGVRGVQDEGKFVVAFLFLGACAAWVTLARWLAPLSTRPGHALLLSCLLLATSAILVFLEGAALWLGKGPTLTLVRVTYGWWISLVASALAALCALHALRSALAAAQAPANGASDPVDHRGR